MAENNIIGKVTATEKSPTTTQKFIFWLKDGVEVSPFDIVKAEAFNNSYSYGVVLDIYHITDCPSFLGSYVSSDFGDVETEPLTRSLAVTYVEAEVIHNSKDIYMPVVNGSNIKFANAKEITEALGLDRIENPIPAGYIEMSNGVTVPIKFNSHFLLGSEGAHLNISGISGLATKTSYAMFILQAVQQYDKDVAIVILNVKGKDLLSIDEENLKLSEKDKKMWRRSGLIPKPFDNVTYYYPFTRDKARKHCQTYNDLRTLENQIANKKIYDFIYTYDHDRKKLDLLFSNISDPNFTMESILNFIMDNPQFRDLTWGEFKEQLDHYSQAGIKDGVKEIPVQSWRKFNRLIKKSINDDIFRKTPDTLNRTPKDVFLSEEIEDRLKKGDVMVVDIAKLSEQMQCLVFGDIIRSVYNLKLGQTDRSEKDIPNKIIVFVDELNKYASSDAPKNSPILNQLLEITERGRSMGIVLFSAEQFKSAIHDRVKGNCSTNIYGRTNAIEIAKKDYRYIEKVYQNMMTRLKKGELIIQHPVFRSLLKIRFPQPAYRQEEQ